MTGPGIHLQKRLSRAGKTTLIGLVAAIMSWVVLFGTLQVALSVPSDERLSPLAQAGALDYSLGPGGLFESLRASFIARILGFEPGGNALASGASSDDSILAAPSTPTPPSTAPARLPRTVVEHPFDNDDFDDAYPVSTIPFTGKTDTRAAERESGEPDDCEPAGGTVWYRYRPTRNLGLLANSFGSDHPVALSVFRGSQFNDLTLVDCDVHLAGDAQVVFAAQKDRSYFFQVAAPVSGGDLVFSLDPLGTTELVSVARDGKDNGNSVSRYASVSADGRFVAFQSGAKNLVKRKQKKTCFYRGLEENENQSYDGECPDIFVRDMATRTTELVSKSSRGVSSNGISSHASISGDGRYVAFFSAGSNLVPGDRNRTGDVFLHDRVTHRTERISVSSKGDEGTNPWASGAYCDDKPPLLPPIDDGFRESCANNMSEALGVALSISSDGRYVAFASTLHGLIDPEPPHCTDLTSQDYTTQANHGYGRPVMGVDVGHYACRHIYVRDLKTDETRLVSVSSEGEPAEGDSAGPFISRNGRWVVFSSSASNLVDGDTNDYRDVFVHDLRTGTTERASVSTFGRQGDEQSGGISTRGHMSICNNGRWVTFISHASNLTEDDENQLDDLFLKDMRSGELILVTSLAEEPSVTQTDQIGGVHAVISADGRYIAFTEQLGNPSSKPVQTQIFVYDRVTRTMARIDVATSGKNANGNRSQEPEISADGHFVVFNSNATNFDHRDDDDFDDVYIHELPWTR